MKQVQGIQHPIADDALRDDGDHVRVMDHILGHVRCHYLPGHEGIVPILPLTLRQLGYRCSVPFFS